jgi:diketogulonate reductase-like aldo/keto reductase
MKQHDIAIESYGPLTPTLRHPSGGPLKPVLKKIAKKLSTADKPVDEATVLLLWTRAKGAVAVTTSGKADRIRKVATVDALPDLDAADVEEIEAVGKKVHFRHYVSGLKIQMSWCQPG